MKKLNYIFSLLILSGLSLIMACKGDDTPPITEAERITQLMTGVNNWSPQSITADGKDVSELFEGFTLKFNSNNTYTSTGETPVWARNGTWTFTSDAATSFRKEDDNIVEIIDINQGNMRLRLNWTETTYKDGRSSSISGVHEFVLSGQ